MNYANSSIMGLWALSLQGLMHQALVGFELQKLRDRINVDPEHRRSMLAELLPQASKYLNSRLLTQIFYG